MARFKKTSSVVYLTTMKRYPLDKFPKVSLRPESVVKHEENLLALEEEVDRYTKIGHRDGSLFDWILRVFENLGLSTVKNQYLGSLAITKTRLLLFTVLIDDPVDNESKRDFKLFEELIKIPFNSGHIEESRLNSGEKEYLGFTKEIWSKIIDELKTYPNYKKYEEAFIFDIKQLLNSMEYSRFANTYPNGVNTLENGEYLHHSTFVLPQTDLDLMCSDGFNDREFGMLRELSFVAGKMARIGNLIKTYPRELLESDMSSEALVKFQKEYGEDFKFKINKLLNREQRYLKFEEKLIAEYGDLYKTAKEVSKEIKSIDVERFLQERNFVQKAYELKADYW